MPFYREYFEPGITLLTDFLIRIGVASARISAAPHPLIELTPPPERQPEPEPEPQRAIAGQGSIEEAIDLLEATIRRRWCSWRRCATGAGCGRLPPSWSVT
ncbi:MAG: hypothetical protein IPK19_37020 [Chloroflexi bacterium]|nr:hypothetical protein [Chloroflexota bacterium]